MGFANYPHSTTTLATVGAGIGVGLVRRLTNAELVEAHPVKMKGTASQKTHQEDTSVSVTLDSEGPIVLRILMNVSKETPAFMGPVKTCTDLTSKNE